MSAQAQPEGILRGLYRLLAMVSGQPARGVGARVVQKRLIEDWPAFLATEESPAQVAVRAEILDLLSHASFALTGQAFDVLCAPVPAAPPPAVVEGAVHPLMPVECPDDFVLWLDTLVASGAIRDPAIIAVVEQSLHRLLPDISSGERGTLIQRIYDAGVLFVPGSRVSLVGAHLSRTELVDSLLVRGRFSGANLRAAKLVGADLSHAVLSRAVLIAARLGWAHLTGADLVEAELAGAVLMGANLVDADLSGANLVKATLKRANLAGATLTGANLLGCNLEAAVLTMADLTGSNLLWADFSDASLDGADLTDAVYNVHAQWPAGFDPTASGLILID